MSPLENPSAMMRQAAEHATRPETTAERWRSLHESAQIIASMAALANEPFEGELAGFPDRLAQVEDTRREHAETTLEDLDAILQPGLTALLAIQARGQDTTAPALALWREYHASRSALMSLCTAA